GGEGVQAGGGRFGVAVQHRRLRAVGAGRVRQHGRGVRGDMQALLKATVAAGVTPDLTARLTAVELVQAATAALGGKGGGGRPDRAQGGAPSLAAADAAIAAIENLIGGK
ncbi:MAG TPA: DHHA1 domain-containing protein, partial [Paracoccus sp. (in: a-proteobacteria)]|nr:DHHA1 domain-containing protein [Paracoccus sp. (in: a-proteobacteria)]